MKLRLERQIFGDATIGELFVDGQEECATLEDRVREVEGQPVIEWKVKKETAIPKGTYTVVIDRSERFSKIASEKAGYPVEVKTPHLLDVPGFDGIRIHKGNTPADIEGCIAVGRTHTDKSVGESKIAYDALFEKIEKGLQDGDHVTIEIV